LPLAEYGRLDGLGLADLVRRREVTPRELVDEAIARAERVNPRIGAVIAPRYEDALVPHGVEAFAHDVVVALHLGFLLRLPGVIETAVRRVFAFIPFSPLANISGEPSMSVPLTWNAAGLPIGVQLAARLGDEATLFRVAAQLEAARPWAARRPPVHADVTPGSV